MPKTTYSAAIDRLDSLFVPFITDKFKLKVGKYGRSAYLDVVENDANETDAETRELLKQLLNCSCKTKMNALYSATSAKVSLSLYFRYYGANRWLNSESPNKKLELPESDADFLEFLLFSPFAVTKSSDWGFEESMFIK